MPFQKNMVHKSHIHSLQNLDVHLNNMSEEDEMLKFIIGFKSKPHMHLMSKDYTSLMKTIYLVDKWINKHLEGVELVDGLVENDKTKCDQFKLGVRGLISIWVTYAYKGPPWPWDPTCFPELNMVWPKGLGGTEVTDKPPLQGTGVD